MVIRVHRHALSMQYTHGGLLTSEQRTTSAVSLSPTTTVHYSVIIAELVVNSAHKLIILRGYYKDKQHYASTPEFFIDDKRKIDMYIRLTV